MMKANRMTVAVLASAAALLSTAPALAKGAATLTAGGRTIAGPGDSSIAASASETVAANVGVRDVCATVINTGSAGVDVTLEGAGTQTIAVASRKTASVCENDVTSVSL